MSHDISAAIAGLRVPGEPGALRDGARQIDEAAAELRQARHHFAAVELGPGGRLRRSVGTLRNLQDATTHALGRDHEALAHVVDRLQHFAQVVERLQEGELPGVVRRWHRVREEAMAGGDRADNRVAHTEQQLVAQYEDVLAFLDGHALVTAVHGAVHGGDDDSFHAAESGGGVAGMSPAERAQTYQHTLEGILEDLDHIVREWRTADGHVAEAFARAMPQPVEVAAAEGGAAFAPEDHDRLSDAIDRLEHLAEPLERVGEQIRGAAPALRAGRNGREDRGDGTGWHLPKFNDAWAHHYDGIGKRLRRAGHHLQQLREEVHSLDERFAAMLAD